VRPISLPLGEPPDIYSGPQLSTMGEGLAGAKGGSLVGEKADSKRGSLKERLCKIRDALLEGLIERDESMRLVLLAALAGEHVLLIGPPGTAKSEMARRLHLAFSLNGGKGMYFERLLTRFTVPEELFGPLSISALEKDRYERKTERYLPTASVAFIDEIFKANSAILNALLTLLNEREFDNGSERVKTPLISVVGASNELPKEDELAALFDRFLVRYQVGQVSAEGFSRLLDLRGKLDSKVDDSLRLKLEDLRTIQEEARLIRVPESVKQLLSAMRTFLEEQEIPVSDRRWRKILFLLQVSAYSDGRREVSIWDAWLVQHCVWHTPKQRQLLVDWYHSRLGTLTPSRPEQFANLTVAWEAQLDKDRTSQTQVRDDKGRPVFVDHSGKTTVEAKSKVQRKNVRGEPLYVAPPQTENRTNSGKGYTRDELHSVLYYRSDEWADLAAEGEADEE